MNKTSFSFLVILCSTLFFSACNLINPDEEEPVYLTIEKPVFDSRNFGTPVVEIPSVWVSVNNKFLGVFDLPVTVPVLASGSTIIHLDAGVIGDGQRTTRLIYPFYTGSTDTLQLIKGQHTTITPKFTYRTDVTKALSDGFQDSFSEFEASTPYNITLSDADSLQFDGSNGKVGVVYSKPDTTRQIEITSTGELTLPQNARPVFLEFNIKSTIDVQVGLQLIQNGTVIATATDLSIYGDKVWKKFYVNLANEANIIQDPTVKFKVIFSGRPNANGKDYIALDNIQVLHYSN